MQTTTLITDRLFDGRQLAERGCLRFDENGVIGPGAGETPGCADSVLEMPGRTVLPGLIDLHSDALEKCIEMRAEIFFDSAFALQNLDRRLAACGITTFFHAVSFADNELGLRSPEKAEALVHLIHAFTKSRVCLVRHRIHARFEIGSARSLAIIEKLLQQGRIDLFSFMDHTPGQGQFRNIQSYLDFYQSNYRFSPDTVTKMIQHKQNNRGGAWQQASALASKAVEAGVPILSHDDDMAEKVELVHRLHASGCEFPITMEAVEAAVEKSMDIFMGAPNLIRGASTNGHLKAADTIRRGVCNGLVSDYYPECLLQAPFIAMERLGVEPAAALKLVTTGPGTYVDPSGLCGTLREGARADFIVVNTRSPWKSIEQTWVDGRCVYHCRSKQPGEEPPL